MSVPSSPVPEASGRPILRWAGSKRQLLPLLRQYWSPDFERYVEPFCGSSALFFVIRPARALLADSNSHLIEFYEELRDDPVTLWREVTSIPQTPATYEALRTLVPARIAKARRAVRFLYLNRNCFNGLYRTNNSGQFNVPFAPSRTGAMPALADFINAADRLKTARLRSCDFGHTLRDVRNGDFVYLDPPFFVRARRVFRDYGPRRFLQQDIDRLGAHLDKLHARGAKFLLSFADCSEARKLAVNWIHRRVRVRRQIAGFADNRRFAYELIISNTAPI